MTEIDHEYTAELVCPYCGYENLDSWELSDDDGETYCGSCDKEFTYTRNVRVTYSTKKLED